jgi:hypothetical protein
VQGRKLLGPSGHHQLGRGLRAAQPAGCLHQPPLPPHLGSEDRARGAAPWTLAGQWGRSARKGCREQRPLVASSVVNTSSASRGRRRPVWDEMPRPLHAHSTPTTAGSAPWARAPSCTCVLMVFTVICNPAHIFILPISINYLFSSSHFLHCIGTLKQRASWA